MTVEYDMLYNIGYIRFKEIPGKVTSLKISEDLVIDMAGDGSIYGIELLNLSEQLFGDKAAELVVYNENTGHQEIMKLPS